MKKIILLWFLVQAVSAYVQAQTIEQQMSYRLSPFYAATEQPSTQDNSPGHDTLKVTAPTLNSHRQYPPGLLVKTTFSGSMLYLGGGFVGALIGGAVAKPFINTSDEWSFIGFIPYILIGAATGATGLGSVGIHYTAKKHCQSSYWYAAGGILLTLGLGTVLAASTGEENIAYAAIILAPISGTMAYFHFGKPIDQPKNNKILNE